MAEASCRLERALQASGERQDGDCITVSRRGYFGGEVKTLAELNAELGKDLHENEILDGPEEQSEDERDENIRRRDERNDR